MHVCVCVCAWESVCVHVFLYVHACVCVCVCVCVTMHYASVCACVHVCVCACASDVGGCIVCVRQPTCCDLTLEARFANGYCKRVGEKVRGWDKLCTGLMGNVWLITWRSFTNRALSLTWQRSVCVILTHSPWLVSAVSRLSNLFTTLFKRCCKLSIAIDDAPTGGRVSDILWKTPSAPVAYLWTQCYRTHQSSRFTNQTNQSSRFTNYYYQSSQSVH